MSRSIHQTVCVDAPIERVYSALTQAELFAKMTGKAAEISLDPGGAFRGFDGMVSGRQIDLVSNQRLVQAWRVGAWPEGVFSLVRFDFATTEDGTQIVLEHVGFPDEAYDHLVAGWNQMYWQPLRKFVLTD